MNFFEQIESASINIEKAIAYDSDPLSKKDIATLEAIVTQLDKIVIKYSGQLPHRLKLRALIAESRKKKTASDDGIFG